MCINGAQCLAEAQILRSAWACQSQDSPLPKSGNYFDGGPTQPCILALHTRPRPYQDGFFTSRLPGYHLQVPPLGSTTEAIFQLLQRGQTETEKSWCAAAQQEMRFWHFAGPTQGRVECLVRSTNVETLSIKTRTGRREKRATAGTSSLYLQLVWVNQEIKSTSPRSILAAGP